MILEHKTTRTKGPIFFERKDGKPKLSLYVREPIMRSPRKGEYYLSGAIPAAYIAPHDFPATSKYYIVSPVRGG
jgi:hypothetical protein